MAERAKDWIRQARRDLAHAENDMASGFYEWACFSAQQATEKAVKAVFFSLHAEVWGHSITHLLRELAKNFVIDETLVLSAKNLDKFYIPSRYPNGFDQGTPEDYFTENDAKGAIEDARKIIQFCESKVSGMG